ncbi:adenosine receptor A3-like [Oculina patagonica]
MAGMTGADCSSTSTHYYPAAQQFSKAIYIFACVVSVIISVSSTIGNTMILFALRKCQSLHPPSKALLCSLALTDLFAGLVVLPLFITYFLMIILEMPTYFCAVAITYGRTTDFIGAVSLQTIATIAIDRYLAFHLRLRYRGLVKLRRVVCILVIEWILAAVWTGSWFINRQINLLSGAIGLFLFCLITSLCYLGIHRGLRRHVAQIQHEQTNSNSSESTDFNLSQYRKTVNNMLWIYALLLVCYMPHLTSLLAILAVGVNNATRFALHFSPIAAYFNSSLNPVLYCWKIKELKENVTAFLSAFCNFISR